MPDDRTNRCPPSLSPPEEAVPCCTGTWECLAWPLEWGLGEATAEQKALAADLAAHWLAPFTERGVSAEDVSSPRNALAEARLCPVVQVISNKSEHSTLMPGRRADTDPPPKHPSMREPTSSHA